MGVVTTFNKGMIMEIDQTGNTYGFLFSQDVHGNIVVTATEKSISSDSSDIPTDAGERDINGRLIKTLKLTGEITAKQCMFYYGGEIEGTNTLDLVIGFISCSNIVIVQVFFFFIRTTDSSGITKGVTMTLGKGCYYELRVKINDELPVIVPLTK